MESIRVAAHKLPSSVLVPALRYTFSLPAGPARTILDDVTKPRRRHRPWFKVVHSKGNWHGAWIGEGMQTKTEPEIHQLCKDADIVLFNVHGGGFRLGKPTMYMECYISWLEALKAFGLKVLMMSVHYGLAPEHKYPEPLEDVVRAYRHLIWDMGITSQKVVMTGDSAGASLLLETLLLSNDPENFKLAKSSKTTPKQFVESALPRPAGIVAVSPIMTDVTTSNSWKENIKYDFISQHTADVIKQDYIPEELLAKGDGNRFMRIADMDSGFKSWMPPHMLCYLGGKEVLLDDGREFALKVQNEDINVTLVIEPDCIHDWVCVRETVRDKEIIRKADQTFAHFINEIVQINILKRNQYLSPMVEELIFIPTELDPVIPEDEEEEPVAESALNELSESDELFSDSYHEDSGSMTTITSPARTSIDDKSFYWSDPDEYLERLEERLKTMRSEVSL